MSIACQVAERRVATMLLVPLSSSLDHVHGSWFASMGSREHTLLHAVSLPGCDCPAAEVGTVSGARDAAQRPRRDCARRSRVDETIRSPGSGLRIRGCGSSRQLGWTGAVWLQFLQRFCGERLWEEMGVEPKSDCHAASG